MKSPFSIQHLYIQHDTQIMEIRHSCTVLQIGCLKKVEFGFLVIASILLNVVCCITFSTIECSWSALAVCPYTGIATHALPMVVFCIVKHLF